MPEEIATIERRTPNAEPQNCLQFSIIIPVYNCEKYISKCLDSLINQDIPERNYEILITDDGSTDQTPKILDAYAEKFPFIHVTHTENLGPSHARNVALDQAGGKYIAFCDGDDFVSPCMLSVLTWIVEEYDEPDFMTWHFYTSDKFPADGFPVYDTSSKNLPDCELVHSTAFPLKVLEDGGYSHIKALKREVMGDIRFDEELRVCEDEYFFISILAHRKNLAVCLTDFYLYCYVMHKNVGLTRGPENSFCKDGVVNLIPAREKILAVDGIPEELSRWVKNSIYFYAVRSLYRNGPKMTDATRKKLYRYMREYGFMYFTSSDSFYSKLKTLVQRILVFLHIHNPKR